MNSENDTDNQSESDFCSDDSTMDQDYSYSNPESVSSGGSTESETSKSDDDESNTSSETNEPSVSGISRENPISPEKISNSRKRSKKISAKEKRKTKRNLRFAYKTVKGVEKAEKSLGLPCNCPNKCRSLLNGTENEVFNNFWDLSTKSKQDIYLFGQISAKPVKRRYPRKIKKAKSSRKSSFVYSIKTVGSTVNVCKVEFLAVHGLQKNRGRVERICSQIAAGKTVPKEDGRGKHMNRANQVPQHIVQSVHEHIQSIPTYTSHYSRFKNPNKVFFDADLTIRKLYTSKYVPWCQERVISPASMDKYRRIFCSSYNIGFKLPKSDTCAVCDKLAIQINENENEAQKQKFIDERNLHQACAERMTKTMAEEIAKAKDTGHADIFSFDLQQTLPTPQLTVGPAFYSRKAWTYNMGLHDCVQNKGFMYMWSEDIAKRGSSEIASSIYMHIKKNPPKSDKLIVYSDNCSGQNKNWALMAFWQQLVREEVYKEIEHRFLITGHTFLPSDRDFAVIENYKKRYLPIAYGPSDWYEAARKANTKTPFDVTEMKTTDFFDFNKLISANIVKKTFTDAKKPLHFKQVRIFKFNQQKPNVMYIQHACDDIPEEVNLSKKGVRSTMYLKLESLPQKYEDNIKLDEKKLKDLRNLQQFIPPYFQGWFKSLKGWNDTAKDDDNTEMITEHFDEISENENETN